jgi:hypothetical protein
LNLGEKNYENLVEALTNDSISSAATSSNLTSSLPQSAPALSSLSNQGEPSRIEESENFHHRKGDIAD